MADKTSMQEEIHYNCRGLLLLPIEATTSFKGKVHGQFIYYISVCNRLFLVANTSVFLGFSSMIMIPSTNSPSYSFHKISLLHGLSLKTPSNIEHELIMPLKFHVPLLNSVVKSICLSHLKSQFQEKCKRSSNNLCRYRKISVGAESRRHTLWLEFAQRVSWPCPAHAWPAIGFWYGCQLSSRSFFPCLGQSKSAKS